jgi:hypothetical protein
VVTASSTCRLKLGAAREETCKASRDFTRSNLEGVDGWVDGVERRGGDERGGPCGVGIQGGTRGGSGGVGEARWSGGLGSMARATRVEVRLSWNRSNYKSTSTKTITEVIKLSYLNPYNSGSPTKSRGISNQPTYKPRS